MVYTYKIPFVGNYNHFTLLTSSQGNNVVVLNLRKVKNKRELINKIKEEEEEEEIELINKIKEEEEEEEMFIK
ncbi:BnaA03g49450D [Brassica napus]|uniref:BnaA03g49450D protein n=1 Tax=Brassica napus TaxID=3708 RepID=A0A078GUP1_BRANA|nr:BnaA03g49450D [Brassica napus]